eukprot:3037781-Amphidinium_carterae.1
METFSNHAHPESWNQLPRHQTNLHQMKVEALMCTYKRRRQLELLCPFQREHQCIIHKHIAAASYGLRTPSTLSSDTMSADCHQQIIHFLGPHKPRF